MEPLPNAPQGEVTLLLPSHDKGTLYLCQVTGFYQGVAAQQYSLVRNLH